MDFALAATFLMATAIPAFAAGKQTRQAKERTARKACLSGDFSKGIDILSDLFVDTRDSIYIFNQGRCLEQNHQYQEAIEKFKEFLRTGETQALRSEDKDSAEKHIAACKETLAAQSPPAPEPLAPPPATMVPTPMPPTPAAEAPPPIVSQPEVRQGSENPGSGLRIAGVVTAVVGIAAVGAGVGLNVVANNTIGDMEGTLDGYSAGKNSDHDAYVTLAWVGYGVGGACLITGAILYGIGFKAKSKSSANVAIVPAFATGQAGAALVGAF